MEILHCTVLPDGHRLLLVETSSSGGGAWAQPVRLAVVETDGGEYTHARCRSVVRTLDVRYPDGRHKGPRSGYHRTVEDMLGVLRAAAAEYRPGENAPSDAVELTADIVAAMQRAAAGGAA